MYFSRYLDQGFLVNFGEGYLACWPTVPFQLVEESEQKNQYQLGETGAGQASQGEPEIGRAHV